ncbi:MAG: hypothetical protein WCT77_00180 [Bacteroidota bacterium]
MVRSRYYNINAEDVEYKEVSKDIIPIPDNLKRKWKSVMSMSDGTFAENTLRKNDYIVKGSAVGVAVGFVVGVIMHKNKIYSSLIGAIIGGALGYLIGTIPANLKKETVKEEITE